MIRLDSIAGRLDQEGWTQLRVAWMKKDQARLNCGSPRSMIELGVLNESGMTWRVIIKDLHMKEDVGLTTFWVMNQNGYLI